MSYTVHHGSALSVLRQMPSESVHMCVTSPPYYGLRAYGTDPQVWGGDPACEHEWGDVGRSHHPGQVEQAKWKSAEAAGKGQTAGSGQFCCKCDAWLGELGLEPTPDLYVAHMVDVLHEVRRVLRNDGCLFLNIGDSYAGYHGNKNHVIPTSATNGWTNGTNENARGDKRPQDIGLKPKDLIMIPHRLAIALQADGWWVRNDNVWAKKNSMPESVTDRCTRSHEYVFHLSKSAKYYYDHEAIMEPLATDPRENYPARARATGRGQQGFADARGGDRDKSGGFPPSYRGSSFSNGKTRDAKLNPDGVGTGPRYEHAGRNCRSVWTFASEPTPDAHFATMPMSIAERCILAGCPPEGKRCDCAEIIETPTGSGEIDDPTLTTGRAGMNRVRRDGEGTRPITRYEQRQYAEQLRNHPDRAALEELCGSAFAHYIRTDRSGARPLPPSMLSGLIASGKLKPAKRICDCPVEPAGVVLDPFGGSGTTALAAIKNGRDAVLIELNADYIQIIHKRLNRHMPLFAIEIPVVA
jgi:DNA modification methylase